MAGVSVKLTADVSGFKKGINEATRSVKTLDAQLETNEKQLKLNGDAELYMKNKTALLQKQLEAQRKVVVNTHKALEAMKKNGVSPTSAEFQKMEQNLAKAQSKMTDIQTDLKNVESGASGAKKETQGMNTQLKNIGKNVAFGNIAEGLKEITSKLESAGRAAVNFGKKIGRSFMDSTGWADDVLTRATKWGVDAETVQRMDNVAEIIDTDAETIIRAQDSLAKHQKSLSELLGIDTAGMSADDAFWAAGEALMAMSETMDELELDETARKVFGTGWRDLLPLLKAGRQEYEQLLGEQTVLTNEQVESLGEADDQIKKMEQEVARLKNEFWAENSETIIGLLQWVMDNKDAVVAALGAIGTAFAAMKIAEFAANLAKVVSGFQTLLGAGGGGAAAGGGGTDIVATAGGGWLKGIIGKVAGSVAGGALTPAAVAAAGIIPTYLLQKSVEDKIIKGYEATEAEIARLEAAGVDTSRLKALNAATYNPNASRTLGFANLNDTEQAAYILSAMGDMKMRGQIYADINKYGPDRGVAGWNAYSLLQRHWGVYEEDGRRVDMPLTQAEINELVEYMIDVEKAKLAATGGMDNSTVAYGVNRRTLPAGYGYNQWGEIVDANGKRVETGTYMWDDRQWDKWIEEHGGAAGEDLEDAAASLETVTQELTGMPDKVAEAVRTGMSMVSFSFGGLFGLFGKHANGLFSVPWDGYPALLHKGERVLTAREADRYTYNNYFGNVNLNNGLEIEALTDSIERRNRRQRSGYGA